MHQTSYIKHTHTSNTQEHFVIEKKKNGGTKCLKEKNGFLMLDINNNMFLVYRRGMHGHCAHLGMEDDFVKSILSFHLLCFWASNSSLEACVASASTCWAVSPGRLQHFDSMVQLLPLYWFDILQRELKRNHFCYMFAAQSHHFYSPWWQVWQQSLLTLGAWGSVRISKETTAVSIWS